MTPPQRDFDFRSAKESDVLEGTQLQPYKSARDSLCPHLVYLNSSLYILRVLQEYPLDYILGADQKYFFWLTRFSLTQTSILTIAKLYDDSGRDVLTLTKFKDKILTDYLKAEYKEKFCCFLRQSKFTSEIEQIKKKVKHIRNTRIAHLIPVNRTTDSSVQKDLKVSLSVQKDLKVSLEEMEKICSSLNNLFQLLCFSNGYMLLFAPYHPGVKRPKGVDSKPDILYFLDLIAKDSFFVNMPETQGERWHEYRERMGENALEVLNRLRKSSGLGEV